MRIWSKRMLYIAVIMMLLLLVSFLGAGYFIYDMLTRVPASCSGQAMNDKRENTPAQFFARFGESDLIVDDSPYQMPSYQTISFPARGEEIQLSGWFIPSETESEQVIIIVHGLRVCRRDPTVLLPAGMLHHNGFNVLLLDLRNHGDSQIQDGRTSAGNREYRDVLGAYDWLIGQGYERGNIGLVGISLGGGAAILAFSEESGISALWIDSSFADIRTAVEAELARNRFPTILVNVAGAISQLAGQNIFERSPLQAIRNNGNRPIFITHGTGDTRLSYTYSEELYAAAGENAELWLVDGLDHVEAIYRIPERYETRLAAFFREALE